MVAFIWIGINSLLLLKSLKCIVFNTLEADMFVVKPIVSCMQGHATSKALELYTSLMRDCKPRSYHLFSFSIYRLILIGFFKHILLSLILYTFNWYNVYFLLYFQMKIDYWKHYTSRLRLTKEYYLVQ